MAHNDVYKKELEKVMFEEQQRIDKKNEKTLDKDVTKEDQREYQEIDKFNRKVSSLKRMIKTVNLKKRYVPNSENHCKMWADGKNIDNVFTSDIEEEVIEEIMLLSVEKEWKILLMMGIGCFIQDVDKKYMEIMKKLAEQQKLYLIIASSDYIYGTNYQFCHGYLSKNLKNMTQEKMIQAFGRIGRQSTQMDYTLRLRDDSLILKFLTPEKDKIEVRNMNRLFG